MTLPAESKTIIYDLHELVDVILSEHRLPEQELERVIQYLFIKGLSPFLPPSEYALEEIRLYGDLITTDNFFRLCYPPLYSFENDIVDEVYQRYRSYIISRTEYLLYEVSDLFHFVKNILSIRLKGNYLLVECSYS